MPYPQEEANVEGVGLLGNQHFALEKIARH